MQRQFGEKCGKMCRSKYWLFLSSPLYFYVRQITKITGMTVVFFQFLTYFPWHVVSLGNYIPLFLNEANTSTQLWSKHFPVIILRPEGSAYKCSYHSTCLSPHQKWCFLVHTMYLVGAEIWLSRLKQKMISELSALYF